MSVFSLRVLEAVLYRNVRLTTTDVEDKEPGRVGKYVWRDENGEGHYWSDTPYRYVMDEVETVAEADEIMFLCPACFARNGGASGTHSVLVTFAGRGVPDDAGSRGEDGKPSRWNASGSSLDDLVLTPSILLTIDPCNWHGFVGSNGVPAGHAG